MAGVTATITALAGAGLSAAQMVDAKKKAKNARQAAKVAMNEYASVKETNKMEALKAPDISSLQFQENAAQVQQAVTGLQEMGPEGAAGVAGVVEQGRQANLQTAQAQSEMNYARDAAVLGTEQEIEKRNTEARRDVLSQEITGAQAAADAANTQFMTGAKGLASSLSTGIGALGEATGLTEGAYVGSGLSSTTTGDKGLASSLGMGIGALGEVIGLTGGAFLGGSDPSQVATSSSNISESDLTPAETKKWAKAQASGISWADFVKTLINSNG